jgi:hypothetical protein
MPGELSDPEQSIPYHYDPRYDAVADPFTPGVSSDLNGYIQGIALKQGGKYLSLQTLDTLKRCLESKGLLHRNMCDSEVVEEIEKFIRSKMISQKVARLICTQ